jgi:hypothetical protein
MIDLKLRINPDMLDVAWGIITEGIDQLRLGERVQFSAPDLEDEDFAEAWESSLQEELDADIVALEFLFTKTRFGIEDVQINPEVAEGITRASSAVRLWLRTNNLSEVEDTVLESQEMFDLDLPPEESMSLWAYTILGVLQECIIEILMGE